MAGQSGFVRPKINVKHLTLLRKVNFYRRLLRAVIRFCVVFLAFLSDNVCNDDDVLMPVFCSRSDVINNV